MALETHSEAEQPDCQIPQAEMSVEDGSAHHASNSEPAPTDDLTSGPSSTGVNGQVEDPAAGNDESTEAEVNGEGEGQARVELDVEHVDAPKKRKNKKRKPASKRGLNKPTGMEEFFADAPLTTEEFDEDRNLYGSHFPFIERILTAIQRFERSRKLSPERRDIFYKWLAYGGVEVAPNMFQSLGSLDTSNMTKTELAVAMSQVSIGTDKHHIDRPDAIFAVDFLGCMKAFLARRAVEVYGLETREKTVEVTTTLERFMDYLLQHDVCPEYRTEVIETRNFCRIAVNELVAIAEAKRRLPGDFNIACSTIFGGEYARGYDGVTSFAPETTGTATFVGFTKEVATHIINFAIAGQAPEHIYQKHMELLAQRNLTVIETLESTGLEITRLEPPTPDTLDIYNTQAREYRPVGTLYARPWKNPDLPPPDLTVEERARGEDSRSGRQDEYVLLIEQAILLNLRVRMILEGTLHKLSSGIWFMDEFINLLPTFDTYLVNELMLDYKKPRWLPGTVQYAEQEQREREEEAVSKVEEERRLEEERTTAEEARQAEDAEGRVGGESEGSEGLGEISVEAMVSESR